MKTSLQWKKGLFSNIFEILSDGIRIGSLKENSWTQSAFGELYGQKFSFKTKGFFNQVTQIYDMNNSLVGKITYGVFRTQTKIESSNEIYTWKVNNMWSTKWSLVNSKGLQISYFGCSTKGKIENELQDDFLVLTGLYISNYYLQASIAVMMVVFLPMLFN
jgi:hypothetical protein